MRAFGLSIVIGLLLLPTARAQDLATACHASSSYDVTLQPQNLRFDRPQPAPHQVDLHDGALRTDGVLVQLNAEDQDRMALFERELRALTPRVRTVAQHGVELAAQAMRAEAAGMQLSSATLSELGTRLDVRARELKQRIAASNSTHDWQGDMAEQYANQLAGDIVPLIGADLAQQAIDAALSGDLQSATRLRELAADLAANLRPRLERRLQQQLRPQVQALCPAIQRLAELQQGVHAANGQPLDLLHISD